MIKSNELNICQSGDFPYGESSVALEFQSANFAAWKFSAWIQWQRC